MGTKSQLWHSRDFLKFWTGDTITQFTGQISNLALPTVAIIILKVSGFQLGILEALGFIAFPTLGLFVGVWVDRMRRKSIMITANLIQVAMLASVPVAFVFGVLGFYQLAVVALVMGITTVFYDVAYQSYLPSLVSKEHVLDGNQKLQTSGSAAAVVGPGVASALMQLLGAALSVVGDAIGTLAGAFALLMIRKPEPPVGNNSASGERHFFAEMREGIQVVTGNKLLWTQAGCTATSNLGTNIFGVAFLLFAYRILGISPGIIGIAFSIGAVGFLLGVLICPAVTKKLGLGNAVALSIALNLATLGVLLARSQFGILIIGAAYFVAFLGTPIYNINQVTLRQIITPNRLQGRMNATMRTIVWGTIPVGSFLGGILTITAGVVPTLYIGALVSGGSFVWIVFGPIFKLKKQPEAVSD